MVNIIKEKLPIEEFLRKKLELICGFAKTTPTIINGNIRKIDRTNLTYIELIELLLMKLKIYIKMISILHHIIVIQNLIYLFGDQEMILTKNKCVLNGPLPEITTDEELYDYFIKNIYYGDLKINGMKIKVFTTPFEDNRM